MYRELEIMEIYVLRFLICAVFSFVSFEVQFVLAMCDCGSDDKMVRIGSRMLFVTRDLFGVCLMNLRVVLSAFWGCLFLIRFVVLLLGVQPWRLLAWLYISNLA